MSKDSNEEVTMTVTMTRSQWCEAVNAIGLRGDRVREDYEVYHSTMGPGECNCGAYHAFEKEHPEDFADMAFDDVKCVCYKNWADDLKGAYVKLAALCDENEVVY